MCTDGDTPKEYERSIDRSNILYKWDLMATNGGYCRNIFNK